MSTLRERMQKAFEAAKLKNQSELAARVGISRASVSDWFTGATQSIEGPNLTKAAAALGVNPHWLATGEGAMIQVSEPENGYGLAAIRTWEHETDLPPGEYAFIPRLEVHLSGGNGREHMEIEFLTQKPQAFRTEWIREQKLQPAKLAVMLVAGDSMEPRIHDGDSVVVDTAQKQVVDGRVYALWYDGGERVKRLHLRPGGGLIIRSDNEAKYPPLTLTPEETQLVRVIGRVVHVSGEGGL